MRVSVAGLALRGDPPTYVGGNSRRFKAARGISSTFRAIRPPGAAPTLRCFRHMGRARRSPESGRSGPLRETGGLLALIWTHIGLVGMARRDEARHGTPRPCRPRFSEASRVPDFHFGSICGVAGEGRPLSQICAEKGAEASGADFFEGAESGCRRPGRGSPAQCSAVRVDAGTSFLRGPGRTHATLILGEPDIGPTSPPPPPEPYTSRAGPHAHLPKVSTRPRSRGWLRRPRP